MPYIQTDQITPSNLNSSEALQVYCGLDTMVTGEVLDALSEMHHPSPIIYQFERALQAPYLDMMLRGFLVDGLARRQASSELRARLGVDEFGNQTGSGLYSILNELSTAIWDRPVNPRSPAQLKDLFYKVMHLPEVWISQKGVKKLSTNREALEKLEIYLHARPLVSLILSIRDIAKQLEVLETDIDSDGRFRTSYNIAGTETGRPSSSSNAFGTGGNAQNIAPALRYIFVADPGYKLCVIDLEQVEARDTGFFQGVLFDDWTFLDACESGDLHTNNSKIVWPELSWTGDPQLDRKIAERQFYRDFSYRDMAKRGGHLSGYYGTAWTMGRSLKIPLNVAEDFQQRYNHGPNCAYPGFAKWWQWTAEQLQTQGHITTPFGRKRHFFGRPGDDTTLREAIAFLPQSTTADRMNLGLWRTWRHIPQVQLLAQTYDSITFQYPENSNERSIIESVLAQLVVPLVAPNGRVYNVPAEAKVGWNWGNAVTQQDIDRAKASGKRIPRLNPGGLVKWKPNSPDQRIRGTGLQRVMT